MIDHSAERRTAEPTSDERLTAFGLLMETSSALVATVGTQLDEHGVTGSEFEVLIRLSRSPEHRMRMTDLATQAMLSASGLTRLVDRLVADGLVDREACPNDRRGSFAVLTHAGLDLMHRVLPGHLALVDRYFTGVLNPSELERFTKALRKVRSVVRPGAEAGAEVCLDRQR